MRCSAGRWVCWAECGDGNSPPGHSGWIDGVGHSGIIDSMLRTCSRMDPLRRKAVVLAACAACLGGLPALTMMHGHRVLGFAVIGLQIVLLVAAMNLLARSKREQNSVSK